MTAENERCKCCAITFARTCSSCPFQLERSILRQRSKTTEVLTWWKWTTWTTCLLHSLQFTSSERKCRIINGPHLVGSLCFHYFAAFEKGTKSCSSRADSVLGLTSHYHPPHTLSTCHPSPQWTVTAAAKYLGICGQISSLCAEIPEFPCLRLGHEFYMWFADWSSEIIFSCGTSAGERTGSFADLTVFFFLLITVMSKSVNRLDKGTEISRGVWRATWGQKQNL